MGSIRRRRGEYAKIFHTLYYLLHVMRVFYKNVTYVTIILLTGNISQVLGLSELEEQ